MKTAKQQEIYILMQVYVITGFSLGSTTEAHTKGIWIWVREHPIDSDNKCLVLLDTEGLGDVKKVISISQKKFKS